MGQVLHGCATTTHAVRAAIQRWKASVAEVAERHGLNRKTVMKWRGRAFIHDAAMGPKAPRSTVLTAEEEAMAVSANDRNAEMGSNCGGRCATKVS